jgi:hypothetical protein
MKKSYIIKTSIIIVFGAICFFLGRVTNTKTVVKYKEGKTIENYVPIVTPLLVPDTITIIKKVNTNDNRVVKSKSIDTLQSTNSYDSIER